MIKQSVADKIRWEGGFGEAFWALGDAINSGDAQFDALWQAAYNLVMELEALMPEEGAEDDLWGV